MKELLPLFLAGFCGYTASSVLFPLIAPYALTLGADPTAAGWIAGAHAYTTAATMVPFGFFADRFSKKRTIILGQLMYVLVPLLYLAVKTPGQLLGARLVHGLALALFIPAANALVVDLAPSQRRGEALGGITAVTQLGFAVGPVLGGLLSHAYGIKAAFLACSLIPVLGLVAVGTGLRWKDTGASVADRPPTWGELSWLRRPLVWAALSAPLVGAFGASTVGSYGLPLYVPGLGFSGPSVGILVTIFFLSSALIRVPAGRLADRWGRVPVLALGFAIEATGIGLISVSGDFPTLAMALVLGGTGLGLANPAGFALLADHLPPARRGTGMGFAQACLQAGVALGPTSMAWAAALIGLKNMFVLCAGFVAFSCLPIYALSRLGFPRTSSPTP